MPLICKIQSDRNRCLISKKSGWPRKANHSLLFDEPPAQWPGYRDGQEAYSNTSAGQETGDILPSVASATTAASVVPSATAATAVISSAAAAITAATGCTRCIFFVAGHGAVCFGCDSTAR